MSELPDVELQDDVNTATYYSQRRANEMRMQLSRYDIDPDLERRQDICQCKACFYLRGPTIAGQAFTTRPCKVCAESVTYANTHTQHYCETCARDLGLCRECGGDLSMEKREDPKPPRRISERTRWQLAMRDAAKKRNERVQAAYKRERGEDA